MSLAGTHTRAQVLLPRGADRSLCLVHVDMRSAFSVGSSSPVDGCVHLKRLHTCVHVFARISVHVHVRVYVPTCLHTPAYTCACACTCTCTMEFQRQRLQPSLRLCGLEA